MSGAARRLGKEMPQMSELKPCPVTQIQAYRAYEKLLEIMEDETDDQTEAFSAAYKALYWIANDYRAQPANEPLTNTGGSFNGTGNVYNGTGPCGNICAGTGGGDSDANV